MNTVSKPDREQLERFAIEVLKLAREGLCEEPKGMTTNGPARWNPRVSKDVKLAARDCGFGLSGEELVNHSGKD